MDKDTSEIAKLTERISKDPKSKLFVPLAEEYKKIGDIEMAIHVLSEGLKNNPAYVTARSLLGRLLYENGDLIAAQKELEEVVKAIPDNLLAQRKLGDLYSLLKDQTEALKHYKIALALNPDDKVFAAMVSKLEEGIEVPPETQQQKESIRRLSKPARTTQESAVPYSSTTSASLSQTTSALSEQQPSIKEIPLSTPVAPSPPSGPGEKKTAEALESAGLVAGAAEKEIALTQEPEDGGIFAEAEQTPDSFAFPLDMEEPEEVLVVEPLDEDRPSSAPLAVGEVLPSERNQQIAPAGAAVKSDISLPAQELPKEESVLVGEQERPTAPIAPEALTPSFASLGTPTTEPKPAGQQPAEESDDFTTDTLAELYISQGFYEKAIEIYQRMLADRPDSSGLREKLERVRAMSMAKPPEEYATAVVESLEPHEEKIETTILEEPKEYSIPVESDEKPEETSVGEPMTDEMAKDVLSKDEENVLPSSLIKDKENHTRNVKRMGEPKEISNEAGTGAEIDELNIFGEAEEYKPAAASEEHIQAEPKVPSADIYASPPGEVGFLSKHVAFGDFETKEHILPDTSLHEIQEEKVLGSSRQSVAARKETIERLENWLKNIKKEK